MEVIRDVDNCPRPEEGTALTIGFFDGVHLGHRVVIGQARRIAALAAVGLTADPETFIDGERVFQQSPRAGATVDQGSTVRILISFG